MKNRLIKSAVVLVLLVALCAGLVTPASAEPPYNSYLYDVNGGWVGSADAYRVEELITAKSLGVTFTELSDMVVYGGYIFLLDKGGNGMGEIPCITVLDSDYKLVKRIETFTGVNGEPESLGMPQGIEIYTYLGTENKSKFDIVVCDTNNARIVRMDMDGRFTHVYEEPDLSILDKEYEEQSYRPLKVSFDNTNRLYVVAENINQGLVCLDPDGAFNCFFGAPEVTADPLTRFWKKVLSLAGGQSLLSYTPTEYSNIVADEKGFIYGSIAIPDREAFQAAFDTDPGDEARKAAANIVRLNAAGEDIIKRMGFIPNCGDMIVATLTLSETTGNEATVTTGFVDVALGGNGIYSCLDRTFGRIFTYDEDGNLLYVFGNGGSFECQQAGTFRTPTAIAYNGDDILVIDGSLDTLTVFAPTDYGATVIKATRLYYDGEYDASQDVWAEVLTRNSNMFYAYIGAGKALYRKGEYAEAMAAFREVENRTEYSKALELYMKEAFGNLFGVIVAIALTLFIGLKIYKGVRKFRAFMRNGVKKVM